MIMKKVLVITMLAATAVFAGDSASVSLEAGYNNNYVVNGVARTEASPYIGVGAVKSLRYADVYLGGTLLPNEGVDQSHWFLGSGKEVTLVKEVVSARGDLTVIRHQSGVDDIKNSTEFGVKLAFPNRVITPYVRGMFDVDLDQRGWFVGAERNQKLAFGFIITPAVEYGEVNNYKAVNAKATLTRPIDTKFGVLTPYAGIGWYDNDFNVAKYKFAVKEFNNTVVYAAGLKLTF